MYWNALQPSCLFPQQTPADPSELGVSFPDLKVELSLYSVLLELLVLPIAQFVLHTVNSFHVQRDS